MESFKRDLHKILPVCPLMSLRKGWELAGGPQVKCEVGLAYCWLQSEEGAHISAGDEEGMVPR